MENTPQHCRFGLFQDSDCAGDLEDSKSISGEIIGLFVRINWMCNFSLAQFFCICSYFLGCRFAHGLHTRTRSLRCGDLKVPWAEKFFQIVVTDLGNCFKNYLQNCVWFDFMKLQNTGVSTKTDRGDSRFLCVIWALVKLCVHQTCLSVVPSCLACCLVESFFLPCICHLSTKCCPKFALLFLFLLLLVVLSCWFSFVLLLAFCFPFVSPLCCLCLSLVYLVFPLRIKKFCLCCCVWPCVAVVCVLIMLLTCGVACVALLLPFTLAFLRVCVALLLF